MEYLYIFGQLSLLQKVVVLVVPLLLAVTVHEAAHGYAAKYFGDTTAEKMGRITLNPIKHIDLMGTIVFPIMTMLSFSVMFGWAKPVPVNFSHLRNPKKDMLWVALAGPASNFAMAAIWAVIFGLTAFLSDSLMLFARLVCFMGVFVNVILMALNLLPMPPLDGGRIAVSLLPDSIAKVYAKLEPFGIVVLLILMATGVLWQVLWPVIQFFVTLLLTPFS